MNKFEDKGCLKGELLGQIAELRKRMDRLESTYLKRKTKRRNPLTMEVGELRERIAQAKEQRKQLVAFRKRSEDRIEELREYIDRLECIAQAKEQRKLLEDRIAALRERIDRLESTYPYDEDGRPF